MHVARKVFIHDSLPLRDVLGNPQRDPGTIGLDRPIGSLNCTYPIEHRGVLKNISEFTLIVRGVVQNDGDAISRSNSNPSIELAVWHSPHDKGLVFITVRITEPTCTGEPLTAMFLCVSTYPLEGERHLRIVTDQWFAHNTASTRNLQFTSLPD
jgi:hypothetical protein